MLDYFHRIRTKICLTSSTMTVWCVAGLRNFPCNVQITGWHHENNCTNSLVQPEETFTDSLRKCRKQESVEISPYVPQFHDVACHQFGHCQILDYLNMEFNDLRYHFRCIFYEFRLHCFVSFSCVPIFTWCIRVWFCPIFIHPLQYRYLLPCYYQVCLSL